MRRRNVLAVTALLLVFVLMATYVAPCFQSHDYYNEPETHWHKIGAPAGMGRHGLSYQTIVSGDLFGNGTLAAVSNYHHGQVGIFVHRLVGESWVRAVLHERFTPESADGWPVKGLVGADIDGDGSKEIVTSADIVSYPTGNEKRPFPGVIYIDLSENGPINPQPLVWGKWGERLANDSFALLVPKILEPRFRSLSNTLKDILVTTCTYADHKHAVRVFILEQPPDGFGRYNYTFVGPDTRGNEPYDSEAFYVRHLYMTTPGPHGNVVNSEMLFYPDAFPGAESVAPQGVETMDFNSDGMMDLIVGLSYYDASSSLLGFELRFLQRIRSNVTNYAFNETRTMRFENRGLFGIATANLDGDTTNGEESLVVGITATQSTTQGQSLFVYLTPTYDESLFEVHELVFGRSVNPYRGVYSSPVVLDGNGDGYDDVIFYCVNKDQPENYYPHGDVVFFQNTAGPSSDGCFVYSSGNVKILMAGQSLTWGLALQQADADSELELTVCLLNPIPYWCPLYDGEISAYYCDVFSAITTGY
ncbi:MAG: hypothetical protein ACP6IT_10260 [Candidatus Thorarchaeota archaeon]